MTVTPERDDEAYARAVAERDAATAERDRAVAERDFILQFVEETGVVLGQGPARPRSSDRSRGGDLRALPYARRGLSRGGAPSRPARDDRLAGGGEGPRRAVH
jgi:hypothetical protein